MKNFKKTAGLGLVGVIAASSAFGVGIIPASAAAGDYPVASGIEFNNESIINPHFGPDVEPAIIELNDVNNDGLITSGDTIRYSMTVTNNSNMDYTYLDYSSLALGAERVFVTDNLPAGETVVLEFTHTVGLDDELTGGYSIDFVFNARTISGIEDSVKQDFYYFAHGKGSDCLNWVTPPMNMPGYDGLIENTCVPYFHEIDTPGVIGESNADFILGEFLYDAANDRFVAREDITVSSTSIADYDLLSEEEFISLQTVGNGLVNTLSFTNPHDEPITLTGTVDGIRANIIGENITGATLEPGETAEFYLVYEITQESLDWGFVTYFTGISNYLSTFMLNTDKGDIFIYGSGFGSFNGAIISLIPDMVWERDADVSNRFTPVYEYVTDYSGANLYANYLVSENYGAFELDKALINHGEEYKVSPVDAIEFPFDTTIRDSFYIVAYGKYSTLAPTNVGGAEQFVGSPNVETGTPPPVPTLNTPTCDVEAVVVIPETDEFTYSQSRVGDEVTVVSTRVSDSSVAGTWTLTIPNVIACDEPELIVPEPTVTNPVCGVLPEVIIPESEYFTYTQSRVGDEVTVVATNIETDEVAGEWKFTLVAEPCPIHEPGTPRMTTPACDVEASVILPEDEYYTYTANRDGSEIVVTARNNDLDVVIKTWTLTVPEVVACDVEASVKILPTTGGDLDKGLIAGAAAVIAIMGGAVIGLVRKFAVK